MKERVKVFFATDVHGSEVVWRKWLSVAKLYEVDVLILAGDLTGKAIVPIVRREDGTYICKLLDKKLIANSEKELEHIEEMAKRVGYYTCVLTPDELEDLRNNPEKLNALFKKVVIERMESWLNMLVEKVPPSVKAIVMPGNDDIFDIDPVIKKFEQVIYPLNKCVPIFFDYEMISLDYTNPTPWQTPREHNEEKMWKKLEELADLITVDWKKVICNFHCPPHNTHIDLAPKLDRDLKVVSSIISPSIQEHVGSKAIYRFMKEYQPLLGLHGHIHESSGYDYIGSTIVFNPGSEYSEGILRGFIFEFTKEKLEKWWRVSG